jgi:hypothetical protein
MYRLVVLALFLLVSCEKNIDLQLEDAGEVLVVDATIENDLPPVVILTRSFAFFSYISPAILSDAFVHDAEVYLSNGAVTHKLKEYAFPLAPGYVGYFYSNDTSTPSTVIVGALETDYTLRIISEQKEYTSSVRIPALASVPDSIWLQRAPLNPDTNKRVLYIKATDPPGLGNYARYFTKKNSQPFYPGENSVFDDQVINGTTYSVILPPGVNKNDPPKSDSNFFKRGDTVILKFTNIDRSVYKFWSSWEFARQSIGNPFAQPNKVQGNINNGALGVFSGYAAWYRTVIAQ